MNNKKLERWKLKTKGIFHKIVYDEFWFYIDDLMKENKRLTNNWNVIKEYVNCRIEEFRNAGKSRKEIKAHHYYKLLCDIEKILNSSL